MTSLPMERFLAVIESVEVVEEGPQTTNIFNKVGASIRSRVSQKARHVEYVVRVERGRETAYEMKKRFSEFAALHDFLKKRFGKAFPLDLPNKSVVRRFDQATLEDRRVNLNTYLKTVCEMRNVLELDEVQRFFDPNAEQMEVTEEHAGMSFAGPPAGRTQSERSDNDNDDEPPQEERFNPAQANVRRASQNQGKSSSSPAGKPDKHQDAEDELIGWDR